jgi:Zn-dependent protease with chaperone function
MRRDPSQTEMSRDVKTKRGMWCFAAAAAVFVACLAPARPALADEPQATPAATQQTAPASHGIAPGAPVVYTAAQTPAPQPIPGVPIVNPAPDGGKATPAEIALGKNAAQQIEKEYKVLDDPADVGRIMKIIQRLAPHTQRPAMQYQAKVVNDPGINAFSLPAGYIYVTKGLLGAIESEDELAAVIAHEMGHVNLKHGIDLARREAKMNSKVAVAVLASVIAGKNVDPGSVAMIGSLFKAGLLSGYSQQAETQADANGVVYLQQSGVYHPVAMLTVIEGLARMEITRPYVEMGIFRTHPFPQQRAEAVRAELVAMGVDINPRLVLATLQTKADTVQENGRTIGRVHLDDYVVFEPAVDAEGLSPQQRAEKAAADLSRQIMGNLQMYQVRVDNGGNQATVLANGQPVITVLPGDADFHKTTVDDLAKQAVDRIKLALWQEAVRRAY